MQCPRGCFTGLRNLHSVENVAEWCQPQLGLRNQRHHADLGDVLETMEVEPQVRLVGDKGVPVGDGRIVDDP